MATPVVSGAVALMLQKDPSLNPDTVKARLMKTASKKFPAASTAYDPTTGKAYTSVYDMFTVGAGYVDLTAALANYDRVFGSAASPQLLYNSTLKTAFVVPDLLSTWWLSFLWNPSQVWGGTVLQPGPAGSMAVWGTAVAWGSSGQWGTAVAWGTNGPSGTAVAWGTSGNGEK
jgi:serine protease AprX